MFIPIWLIVIIFVIWLNSDSNASVPTVKEEQRSSFPNRNSYEFDDD